MRLNIKVKNFLFSIFLLAGFLGLQGCSRKPAGLLCEPSALRIHFIDVGEGDAVFIEAPGEECALIDAGNAISGFKTAQYLKQRGADSLDYLIFTHHHLDHIMGAFFVLQEFDVKSIYDNGQDLNEADSDIYRWYSKLARKNADYGVLKAGDRFSLGEVIFEVLWPYSRQGADFNVNSLVIMVKYRGFRCLLTGDLTAEAEKRLLEEGADLKADVLKVGHHAASDAACPAFLRAVRPGISIVSVDKDNIRGYPSKDTLERLEKAGSKIMRTDENGDIIIGVDSNGIFRVIKQD